MLAKIMACQLYRELKGNVDCSIKFERIYETGIKIGKTRFLCAIFSVSTF